MRETHTTTLSIQIKNKPFTYEIRAKSSLYCLPAARLPQRQADSRQVRRYVQDVLPIRQCRRVLRSCVPHIRHGQERIHRFQGNISV